MIRFAKLSRILPVLAFCLGLTAHADAQTRGLTVELRTAPEPTAPVAERVELYQNSYALVVGNDAYNAGWPSLSNAVADAKEIATTLKAKGFEVILKENLDGVALRDTLKEFFAIKGADPNARLLLWYAGHGHSIKGEGFLVPIDAPLDSDPEFKLKSLHMRDFGGLMRLAESKHVLAIFDSCFSGTIFTTRAGSVPAAITRVTAKPTRQFMTSGDAEQQVSDDGTFRRLFTRALNGESTADANGDGYLTGTELGLFLSNEMTNYTEEAQTPRYGKLRDPDYDRGDFVFALPGRTLSQETAPNAAGGAGQVDISAAMAEIALWTSVVASEDPAVVKTYLDKYPTGHFSKAAQARIGEINELLKARAEAAAQKADTKPAGGDGGTGTQGKDEQPQTAQDGKSPGDTANTQQDASSGQVSMGADGASGIDKAEPAFQLEGGINLTEVGNTGGGGGNDDTSWLPNVEGDDTKSFQLAAQKLLPANFFGGGTPAAKLAKDDKGLNRDVGPQGYAVDNSAWSFSDPQGDSQYKIENGWIHMRTPANHNLWDCARYLAPILSVPAPETESWSAQVWIQMPARIGKSHVGLVAWNGAEKEDGKTRALYFGPSSTKSIEVNGSFRTDCSGTAADFARLPEARGKFTLHHTGGSGWLRISKSGDRLTFYFKSPFMNTWREVGSVLSEVKDNLVHVGLMAKTWGSEPVIASFRDFRVIPGHANVEARAPAYYDRLADLGQVTFEGTAFEDFEWDDPNGDSIHEISGNSVTIKASGGRNMWDCKRYSAPILSVETPDTKRWTAEVEFDLPARIGKSHVGMILWNGAYDESRVHTLYFGPYATKDLVVNGSNAVDCSGTASDFANQFGSEGKLAIKYNRGKGKLRISRDGDRVSFYFKAPEKRNWELVGSMLASVRDDLTRIGLMAKSWGSEPVVASFSNFRILDGETVPERWVPRYYAGLRTGKPVTFSGAAFSDFEWSDPDGNSVHEIRGRKVHLKTTGGHSGVWDCYRNKAPILSVEVPPRDAWVAQVRYRVPKRAGKTSANLVLWNGAEHGSVKSLMFGPVNAKGIAVSGSYSDDCSAQSYEIAKHEGNSGDFVLKEGGDAGILQIVKYGWFYKFAYFDPATGSWIEVGTVKSTVKDDFKRIGIALTSWGSNPIEAEFSDFTIVPGLFN